MGNSEKFMKEKERYPLSNLKELFGKKPFGVSLSKRLQKVNSLSPIATFGVSLSKRLQ